MFETNYESLFTKGGTSIGKCVVTSYPELSVKELDVTNHSSGGVSESIPSKLIRSGSFTLSVLIEAGTLIAMKGDMSAQTVEECVITDAIDVFTFDGYYTNIQKENADARDEDAQKVTVTIATTGGVAITAVTP